MIWLDITDPKYALFFNALLPYFNTIDKTFITTRKSDNYKECAILLEKFNIQATCVGGYGGEKKIDKLKARLMRQEAFLKLFKEVGIPKLFITGASVEGAQSAFGLGIPIIHFSDTPIAASKYSPKNITALSRLTLPLSSLIFHPFVVPDSAYNGFGIESKNIIKYNFIDIALWLDDLQQTTLKQRNKTLHNYLGLERNLPLILAREEEYKAHYVKQKLPIFYQAILALSKLANIVIMPRYESDILKKEFIGIERIRILEEKLFVEEFYPSVDMFFGGGGTMTLEACFLGIPSISTRSLLLYHDTYLIKNNLMRHCKNIKEILETFNLFYANNFTRSNNRAYFIKGSTINIDNIINTITKRFY